MAETASNWPCLPANRWRCALSVLIMAAAGLAWLADAQGQGFGGPGNGMFGQNPAGPPAQDAAKRRRRPSYGPPGQRQVVMQVKITGNKAIPESRIRSQLQTRADRNFDPELVQTDVRTLMESRMFRDVRTYKQEVPGGISVTFEVAERPVVKHIRFEGNEQVGERKLLKKLGFKVGDPLNPFTVEEGRRKLEEFYQERGNSQVEVEVTEGSRIDDQGATYVIREGKIQRFSTTRIEGNTFQSDSVLIARAGILSKPGPLWYFKGKVDYDQIEQDVQRLTAYYRRFGYFQASVQHKAEPSESEKWVSLTFVVQEGPRFQIRDIRIEGNQKFASEKLAEEFQLNPGEYFNADKMQRDINSLRDQYGSVGHIFADVQTETRFLEEPGLMDLVFTIQEGQQWRVGNIIVNIDGDHPHTRRSVVMNRLGMAPGDIIDSRQLRDSERRLKHSQLFMNDPVQGKVPTITVLPPEMDGQNARMASRGRSLSSNDQDY